MKKILSAFLAALAILAMLTVAASAADPLQTAFASWSSPVYLKGGYPRLAECSDGSLLRAVADVENGVIRVYRLPNSARTAGNLSGGLDNSNNYWDEISQIPLRTTYTTTTNTSHELELGNIQVFALSGGGNDGQDLVMVAFRSTTKNYVDNSNKEFYSSIRCAISFDGGMNFKKTVVDKVDIYDYIVVHGKATSYRGLWEPFMIDLDENTVALYYADDLSTESASSQRIDYILYNVGKKDWEHSKDRKIQRKTAIDGTSRTYGGKDSRDGMPVVTRLADGSFAMVIETHDYNKRTYLSTDGTRVSPHNTGLVISLVRSIDGINWDTENLTPIFAPNDLDAGYSCGAPYIVTLPDGRIAVSCQSKEGYNGNEPSNASYKNRMHIAVSNAPVTFNSLIHCTTGGVSPDFTELQSPYDYMNQKQDGSDASGCQLWNSLFVDSDGYLYALGGGRFNKANGTGYKSGTRIRRICTHAAATTVTTRTSTYTLLHQHTCGTCNSQWTETACIGHYFPSPVIVVCPASGKPGTLLYTCRYCGYQKTEIIPPLQ